MSARHGHWQSLVQSTSSYQNQPDRPDAQVRFRQGFDLAHYRPSGVNGARYMSMEYQGPGVESLSMYDRFTVCNMAARLGPKTASSQ